MFLSTRQFSQQKRARHDGRPHNRRPQAREYRVGPQRDEGEPYVQVVLSAEHRQQDGKQRGHQDSQVKTGDGQQVSGSGTRERICQRIGQGSTPPKQEGLGQRRFGLGEHRCQRHSQVAVEREKTRSHGRLIV